MSWLDVPLLLEERASNAQAITWKVPFGWWMAPFGHVVIILSTSIFEVSVVFPSSFFNAWWFHKVYVD